MLFSWEAWEALCLVECLKPCLPDLTWLPTWPAWELPLPSPREGWVLAWEELLPSPGRRWAVARGDLLPSPWGRWAIAWEELLLCQEDSEQLPAESCFLPQKEGEQLPWRYCFLPLREGEHLSLSLPGRPLDHLLPWRKGEDWPEGYCCLPLREGECLPSACLLATRLLPAWGELLLETLVIFPSFLLTKFWNLLSCLCLTLLNLISPTLSMKPWHFLNLCAEIIDAKLDLHSSVCLPTLSRILLIALILAWIKSFLPF